MIKLFDNSNILSWCDFIEESALDQLNNIAKHPWMLKMAIMPDCHAGKGMPIGTVVGLDNAISPNMVGVDIACGVSCMKTNLNIEEVSIDKLKQILGRTRELVPVGVGIYHEKPQTFSKKLDDLFDKLPEKSICLREKESSKYQLGTLGSGNHFLEFQKDEKGNIWVMIHSGSRNLGYKVCEFYNNKAEELCTKWKQDQIVKDNLAILPIGEDITNAYIKEMKVCEQFAFESRRRMLELTQEAFASIFPNVDFDNMVNIHHNFASLENHMGKNMWVHRKGATSAKKGELGLIPGSQGTSSFMTKGKGLVQSLMSCSHGSGRKMSRKAARENLDIETERKFLDDQGILHAIRHQEDLDEAASAYKDIHSVMKQQEDLVEIIHEFKPLAVIKG